MLDLEDRKTHLLVGDDRKSFRLPEHTSACRTCHAVLAANARYCGMCGQRTRDDEDLTDTVLDGLYRLEQKLAEGGFASVYRATFLPTGNEVAVKVLHARLAQDAHITARFRREGRSLLRLRNPHTVVTYDYGEADGTLYIAMELLHGESLLERLQAIGPLPWREVLRIMRAVCRSLSEAHAHGIVHRDIKPGNIYIGFDGFVKLIDFGLAKVCDDEPLTRAGKTVGTLQYMAPEQLVGLECDGRSDIYSLGVVAYELLTGQRPFGARDTLPSEVDALVQRCLEREPRERFATVDELATELDRLLVLPVRRRSFPHTPAFELQPPRIIELPVETTSSPIPKSAAASLVWLVCFALGGVGLGTAVAQLI